MSNLPEARNADPLAPKGEWLASAQGRKELLTAAMFVLAFAAVPLFCTELFPFSRAPMFADAPQRYCEYTVTDPAGKSLDLLEFGLQRNYWGNPLGAGVGFEPPPSLDAFGEVPSQEAVTEVVRQGLKRFPRVAFVRVSQGVIAPVSDRRVGEVATVWRVENPHFQGPAQ